MRALSIAAALAALSAPLPALAVTATDLITGFNTIVLTDLDASSETRGSVFVGGNISGNSYTVNPEGLPNFTFDNGVSGALVVGGNITSGINMGSGDTAVGGQITGGFNNNGGGAITQNLGANTPTGIPVNDVASALIGASSDLSSLSSTGGQAFTSDNNNVRFVAQANPADNLVVFNLSQQEIEDLAVSGSFLGVQNNDGTLLDSAVTAIVNIDTSLTTNNEFVYRLNPTGASSGQTNVIFNVFSSDPGAPTVEIASSGAFGLLAPTADVQIGNGNAGFVVGNSLDQNG
ncbi:MAG: collagen-binding domain-containing protein, partial [Pseudomonadota bacterium]